MKNLRIPKIPKWLTFVAIFIIFFLASIKNLDPDLGWHIKNGEYFMNGGSFFVEPYTYTASNFSYVDHEWLSNILVYLLNSVGGHLLLSFFFSSLWTLAFFIISYGKIIPSWLLFLAAIGTLPFAGVRFVAFSVLGLAILLRLYESRRGQLFIPLLILVWTNLHGSFIIGILVLTYLYFYDFVFGKKKPFKFPKSLFLPLGTFTASIILTFVNPYGPRVYEEVFRTLFDTNLRSAIAEWGSYLYPLTLPYLAFFILSIIATFKPKKLKSYLAPENIFLLAAFWSQRHWPLFLIMSPPHTATRLRTFSSSFAKQIPTNKPLRRIIYAAAICTTIASAYLLFSAFNSSWDRDFNKPSQAVSYLSDHPCRGHLFNEYNDGGYLIYNLPSHKVYIDGRMPSWSDGDTLYFKKWQQIFTDADFREAQFEKYDIKCVLTHSNREEFIHSLQSENWTITSQTTYHTLLLSPAN